MSAVQIDQLIVNIAISRGVTSKPLCTLLAQIMRVWKEVIIQTYNSAK